MISRLHQLDQLRTGHLSSVAFSRAHIAERRQLMDLSKSADVQACHKFSINALALDAVEGRFLLSAGAAGQIFIHDTSEPNNGSLQVVGRIPQASRYAHKFSVETVQWFPTDTGTFTSSSMDKTLRLWDTNRLKPVFVARFEGRVHKHHQSSVNCYLVLLATDEPHAQILDLKTGSKIHMLTGAHSGKVRQCKWSPTVEHLCVTGGNDGRVCIWDIRYTRGHLAALDIDNTNQQKANHHKAHQRKVISMEFTNDGLELVTFGTDNTVRMWDVALAKNRRINFGRVSCDTSKGIQMAFADNSSPPVLFIPSEQCIHIHDATNGDRLKILRAHLDSVMATVYCSYTDRLFSAGNDHNILLWTNESDFEEESNMRFEATKDQWSESD